MGTSPLRHLIPLESQSLWSVLLWKSKEWLGCESWVSRGHSNFALSFLAPGLSFRGPIATHRPEASPFMLCPPPSTCPHRRIKADFEDDFIWLTLLVLDQSGLTLFDPVNSSPLDSFVHGIFQERMLKWVPTSFSRGSSQSRDLNCVSCISCISRQIGYHSAIWEAQDSLWLFSIIHDNTIPISALPRWASLWPYFQQILPIFCLFHRLIFMYITAHPQICEQLDVGNEVFVTFLPSWSVR